MVRLLGIEKAVGQTGLFNAHETESQIKFFTDNLELHVYLQDDIIIKQGDLAGHGDGKIDDYVYFIVEGLAEVIQEKRDFLHFNLDSME